MIDRDTVNNVAYLARLSFTADEAAQLEQDLGRILGWIEQLTEIETGDAAATTQVVAQTAPLRDDVLPDSGRNTEGLEQVVVRQISPDKVAAKEGFFSVPAIIDDGAGADGEDT